MLVDITYVIGIALTIYIYFLSRKIDDTSDYIQDLYDKLNELDTQFKALKSK